MCGGHKPLGRPFGGGQKQLVGRTVTPKGGGGQPPPFRRKPTPLPPTISRQEFRPTPRPPPHTHISDHCHALGLSSGA